MKNIVRKGEIACNKQFLLFSQCFLPYLALIFHFKSTLKCFLQFVSVWTSLKFCRRVMVNSLPNDKIFDKPKFKVLADDKIIVPLRLRFVFRRIENIVRKGENGYRHFLLFPQCFLKPSFPEVLKVGLIQ